MIPQLPPLTSEERLCLENYVSFDSTSLRNDFLQEQNNLFFEKEADSKKIEKLRFIGHSTCMSLQRLICEQRNAYSDFETSLEEIRIKYDSSLGFVLNQAQEELRKICDDDTIYNINQQIVSFKDIGKKLNEYALRSNKEKNNLISSEKNFRDASYLLFLTPEKFKNFFEAIDCIRILGPRLLIDYTQTVDELVKTISETDEIDDRHEYEVETVAAKLTIEQYCNDTRDLLYRTKFYRAEQADIIFSHKSDPIYNLLDEVRYMKLI